MTAPTPTATGRRVDARYDDPLDLVWVAAAQRLGVRIARSAEVYASWDGAGTLTLSTPDDFDADDSLAQLIFHELCHALVAGPSAFTRVDWGLDNTDDRDLVQEHACHRLQAALADRHGLRGLLAVTTTWRPYWDALPADPLAPCDDPALPLALAAWDRARHGPWADTLEAALAATATIAEAVRSFADALPTDSLWRRAEALHPTGARLGPEGARCGDCAWRFRGGRGRAVDRCRRHAGRGAGEQARIDLSWRACDRWEPELGPDACDACGACCREGYHLAPVGAREAAARRHLELLTRDAFGLHLPRPGGRCVALEGGGEAPFRCRIYADRPRACSELPVGGAACLEARRRVGLSR